MNGRVAIVGDPTSVAGFRPLGLAVFAVEDPHEARAVWPDLVREGYSVIFVTEQVHEAIADLVREVSELTVPAVTVIPGSGSPGGVGSERIERAIVRALGTSVPLGSED